MKSLYLLFAFFFLFTLSCNKCNPKKSICANIQYLSNVTGKPVSGIVFKYRYAVSGGPFAQYNYKEMSLTYTYKEGVYTIDHEKPSKKGGSVTAHYPSTSMSYPSFGIQVPFVYDKKSIKKIYIDPMYYLDIKLSNINCQGNDTLITSGGYNVFGCDTVLYDGFNTYPNIGPKYTFDKNFHQACTLKRNGITTYFDVDQVLEESIKNHIYINF